MEDVDALRQRAQSINQRIRAYCAIIYPVILIPQVVAIVVIAERCS
jgi:hypothetical protein